MLARPLDAKLSIHWWSPSDREHLQRLSEEALGEYSRSASIDTLSMSEHLPTLIAKRDGTLIGFAVIELEPGAAHLQAIAVTECERGRGVGRALLRAAESYLRSRGAHRLTLHTAQANVAALSLFLQAGFRIEARLPRYYRGVYAACRLTKTW